MDVLDLAPVQRHRLTVDEYYRMAETGVLAHDARVELIEGEVIDMPPMGTRHHFMVSRLNRLLVQAVGDRAVITPQLPLRLSGHNEPEPDFAVLKPRDDFYASAHPTGHDALLVIEISDSTVAYDLRVKAPLYARHGVPEYWVFDVPARALRFYRQPVGDAYTDVTATETPGRMMLPGLPGIEIDLSGLL